MSYFKLSDLPPRMREQAELQLGLTKSAPASTSASQSHRQVFAVPGSTAPEGGQKPPRRRGGMFKANTLSNAQNAPQTLPAPSPAGFKSIVEARAEKKKLAKDISPTLSKGMRFGKLEVVDKGKTVKKKKMSICKCDCGAMLVVPNHKLLEGIIQDCGYCERMGTIPFTGRAKFKHPLYKAWNSMRYRCYSPNAQQYHNYGARGIKICDEWKTSFAAFRDWAITSGWRSGLSLDRINNDGNYEPSNCRWTDTPTQGRNRRTNIYLTYKGETASIADWAERIGLFYTTILERWRQGWTPEKIIETPKRYYIRNRRNEGNKFLSFSLFINPELLSTGQQKKMNFMTHTIFTDSRVENGMRMVEIAASVHTKEIHKICPPGTRVALTVVFLCPYPSSTKESEKIEREIMGESFDCDNKYKAVGDAFVRAGWWPDDRFVTTLHIEKRRTTATPRIEIIIEPDTKRSLTCINSSSDVEDMPIDTQAIDDDEDLFSGINSEEKQEERCQ